MLDVSGKADKLLYMYVTIGILILCPTGEAMVPSAR